MMKTIFRISLCAGALLAALAMISCTEVVERPEEFSDGIILTFRTSPDAGVQVKSTPTPGVDAFNENLLNSVYYFLYPKDVTDATPLVSGFKTGISVTEEYPVKIPVSANTVIKLFASSNKCQLFAVANPPASLVSELESEPTLADLRSMVVLSSLTKVPQDNFTMVYDDLVDESSLSATTAINVEVPLRHLAVKFTIGALVAPEIEYTRNGVKYTYEPKAVSVSFNNGVNRTTLSGWNAVVVNDDGYFRTEYVELSLSSELYYIYQEVIKADEIAALSSPEVMTEVPSTATSTSPQAIKVDDKYYRLEHYLKASSEKPLYSYPMEWEFNTDAEPYLMYRIDWNYQGSTEDPLPLYYKLTLGRKSITQNEWYDISAKLTIAGSLYPEEPTEIYYYMDYLVNDWKNALGEGGMSTQADIKDTRYLVVQQTEWELNNKEEVTIPFSSSHDCEIVNLTATKTSFFYNGTTTQNSDYGVHVTKNVTGVSATFTDTKGSLKITHSLDNRLQVDNASNKSMDISPIEINFTIRHIDNPDFTEDIHITQYPAIWVETVLNSAGTDGNSLKGYIWINGDRTSNNGGWQTAQGADGKYTNNSNNTCRYFVTIHVSQFDAASNTEGFVVGDPRKDVVDNLTDYRSSIGATDCKAYSKYLQSANQSLSYYRPTIPARSGEENSRKLYVSPVYRVCTAHAKNYGDGNYAQAMYRCATYQEDGYPAGRWRVPTYAEYKLFRYLSDAKLIPNLFVSTGNYYCAGGRFSGLNYTEGFSTTSNQGAVRCVYDEWYWSQVDAKFGWNNNNKTDFVWGDVPVNFVIPTPPAP